jgi:hypothetical protein
MSNRDLSLFCGKWWDLSSQDNWLRQPMGRDLAASEKQALPRDGRPQEENCQNKSPKKINSHDVCL